MANQYIGGGIGTVPKKKPVYNNGAIGMGAMRPANTTPTGVKTGESVKVVKKKNPSYSGTGANNAADKAAQAEALMQMYENQYGQQESLLGDYRSQQEKSATAARDAMIKTAQSNYEKALAMRDQTYQKNTGDVNAQAESALTQAAINNAMQQRNIGQQMAALGRSGGAAESTLMGLNNNYGTVRGGLETTRGDNLANLALDYAAGKAQEEQAFANQKTQYESDYQTKMQNIQDYVTQQLLAARQALMQQKAAALAG